MKRPAVLPLLLVAAFAHADSRNLDAAVAKALVDKTVQQVEAHALPPVSRAEYEDAKQRVRDFVASDAAVLDRGQLYGLINRMLRTIDSDGHTMLWSQEVTQRSERSAPALETIGSHIRLVDTPHGSALALKLPAIRTSELKAMQDYVAATLRALAATEGLQRGCALVLDLSGQTGGNVWPPLIVLEPLFSAENTARYVTRYDERTPVAGLDSIARFKARLGALPPNPLDRFSAQRYAEVYGARTGSAGEALAIALQGETGRTRSFGADTYGMTTGNVTVAMPDNARLLLTTTRYAHGGQPPIRGKLVPDVRASPEAALQQAAEWATANAPACTS